MHILDVISSVSRSSKCIKIVGSWDFAQTSLGEITALPRLPSWVNGPTSAIILLTFLADMWKLYRDQNVNVNWFCLINFEKYSYSKQVKSFP